MPLNKSQRKPSIETLTSVGFDSTLDSRMSSAEIPQMELLKVNYVQQCKDVRAPRANSAAPQLQPRKQQQRHSTFTPAATKYPAYKQVSKANNIESQRAAAPKMPVQQPQPLPPPTIESWKFIHELPQTKPQQAQQEQAARVATTATPKLRRNAATRPQSVSSAVSANPPGKCADAKDYVGAQPCCNSACNSAAQSSCSSDEDDYAEDGTASAYRDCEKSHSWNYRARITTCDIRRDIARAGIKSRADRIARIEKTDCAHQQKESATTGAATALTHLSQSQPNNDAKMPEVVTQINRLFEQAKQPEQQRRSTKQYRAPAPPLPIAASVKSTTSPIGILPKQPLRPAPTPIKEPNMRMRARPLDALPSIEERIKRFSNSSAPGDCLDCIVENSSGKEKEKCNPRYTPEQQRAPVSRIPKPTSETQQQQQQQQQKQHQQPPTSSRQPYNETNEQLQRRIRQMFDNEEDRKQQLQRQITAEFRMQCAGEKIKLRATKSTAPLAVEKPKASREQKAESCEEIADERVVKSTRLNALANFQKLKTERVHIRKKRQPLLIINQLNESTKLTNNTRTLEEQAARNESKRNYNTQCVAKEEAHATTADGSRRTCGYKNCKFTNCPMSATSNATNNSNGSNSGCSVVSTPQFSDEELNTRKRLSLESSCSDSGVSSSADLKERSTKENNMKNLEKCADCVKIMLSQGHTEPTTAIMQQHKLQLLPTSVASKLKEHADDKLKEGQIKIHVGKVSGGGGGAGDPNDVQNFAKKNLTKATTDELLTAATAKNNKSTKIATAAIGGDKLSNRTAVASAAAAASASNGKKCNIANDLKNNEQRIYNNTSCCSDSNNNTNNKNTSNERTSLCATTIKIDDDWVHEQNVCDTDSLMAPSPPTLRSATKYAKARQHFQKSANKGINDNKKQQHYQSPGGDSDKHSVKIFVRSSISSAGVGGNPARASSVSMNSYTSQTSGCSTNSDTSALTSGGKSSTSNSSYTTISSGTSSSNGQCRCNCAHKAGIEEDDDDEFVEVEEGARYDSSLERMTKAGIFFNRTASINRSSHGTQSDTIRACAASPTPSTDTFCEISCIECGGGDGSASSGIGSSGPINGIFWNNSYFQNETEAAAATTSKQPLDIGRKKSVMFTTTTTERNDSTIDENEQCCCSLSSCDDDNCSFYECDGGVGDMVDISCIDETQPDDDNDHCVSRIEVKANVHAPNYSSVNKSDCKGGGESSGAAVKGGDNIIKNDSSSSSGDCVCEKQLSCADNKIIKENRTSAPQLQRIRESERCAARQQLQLEQQWLRQLMRERGSDRQMQFIRNSSAEEILIRNNKLLRKNRLNGLAALAIHHDIGITADEVLDKLSKKSRKLDFIL